MTRNSGKNRNKEEQNLLGHSVLVSKAPGHHRNEQGKEGLQLPQTVLVCITDGSVSDNYSGAPYAQNLTDVHLFLRWWNIWQASYFNEPGIRQMYVVYRYVKTNASVLIKQKLYKLQKTKNCFE